MAVFDYYNTDMEKGFPGMKADATVDVVDSFAVEGTDGLEPGVAVIRGTNPDKQVKLASATDTDIAGITVHTHKDNETPYYPAGYSVPVMSLGDIYVTAGADVVAGTGAVFNGTDKWVTAGSGTDTKVTFLESGADGDVVSVRIRK